MDVNNKMELDKYKMLRAECDRLNVENALWKNAAEGLANALEIIFIAMNNLENPQILPGLIGSRLSDFRSFKERVRAGEK